MMMRPTSRSPMAMSKKTMGFSSRLPTMTGGLCRFVMVAARLESGKRGSLFRKGNKGLVELGV